MTSKPRVLVIFGNIPLLGQERGNIQVFKALEHDVDALFVTHAGYGHEIIQPTLDALGLEWTTATFPGRLSRGMSMRQWQDRIQEIVQNNWEFLRIVREFQPTHIHASNASHFLNLFPALWLLRTPIVYRLGDAPQQHRPLFRFLWRRLFIPRVDRFVCISQYIRRLLLDAGGNPDAIDVIYNHPAVRPAPTQVASLPEPYSGRTVLYMGQISEEKGVGLLVESAIALCAEYPDVRFLIAGDYSWQNPFAEALIQHVGDLGLSDRVRFLGYVEDIPALLAQADVHACPSVWEEPLSNVVPEAKQAGVPSVVFASGGLPELVVEQGVDGYVCEASSAEALAAGLRYYLDLDEPSLATAKSAAVASLAVLGITEESFREAWKRVYESV